MTRQPLLGLALLGFACQGPAGPAGASGEDGTDGLDGSTGSDGTDGADGLDGADGTDGADGNDGNDGADGTDGVDGIDDTAEYDGRDGHSGDPPWGVNLEILAVSGGSGASGGLAVGDVATVSFVITDDAGVTYRIEELDQVYFQLAGPTTHPQVLIDHVDLSDVIATALDNHDGSYDYTFAVAVPPAFAAPPNDSADIGDDLGDWGGLALTDDLDGDGVAEIDGTLILGGVAYIDVTENDGDTWADAGNDTLLILGGAASTTAARTVVQEDNCLSCHGDDGFRAHGGSARTLDLCVSCHVSGAEDSLSDVDASLTPGVTVALDAMIHKIHQGESLVDGFALAGAPLDESLEGYPDYNLHDYGSVAFPRAPMGAADCDACHAGGSGSELTNPGRQACGSCHDGVSFTQTDRSASDYHAAGPLADDTLCAFCHGPAVLVARHQDPRDDAESWEDAGHAPGATGLELELLSVLDQDGSDALEPGDTVTVSFTLRYGDGSAVPVEFFAPSDSADTCPTVAGGVTVTVAGPSDWMQRVYVSPSGTADPGAVHAAATVDTATGTWTYTLAGDNGDAEPFPASYPAQANDSDTSLLGLAYGARTGEPIDAGTYRVAVSAYTGMWDDPRCTSASTLYRAVDSDTLDVRVSGAATLAPRSVVDEANCADCHARVEYHAQTAADAATCSTCHTPGALDDATTPSGTIDLLQVLHPLHAAAGFPRQDGGVAACEACHAGSNAYEAPSTRACMSCHDDAPAQAHAALETDETYGEACDVCHDADGALGVDAVHESGR